MGGAALGGNDAVERARTIKGSRVVEGEDGRDW